MADDLEREWMPRQDGTEPDPPERVPGSEGLPKDVRDGTIDDEQAEAEGEPQ